MGRGGGGRAGGGGGGPRELTGAERDAVGDYTGARYQQINQGLNEGREFSDRDKQFMKDLDTALDALPKHEGTSYRVMEFSTGEDARRFADAHSVGDYVTYRSYTSTSSSREAPGFDYSKATFTGQVRIKIQGSSGSQVSKHSTFSFEREVLFKRGTKFKVTSVKSSPGGGGGIDITLKESR